MAFNPSNYVAPKGNGFVAVVNNVEYPAANQATAEQIFNNVSGQGGGGGGAPPPTPAIGTGGATPWTNNNPPAAAGAVQTAIGPMLMSDVRAGIQAAGGTVTGDDAADLATFNKVDRSGGSQGSGGSSGGGGTGYNPDAARLLLQASEAAAQRAYLNDRLRLYEIPQMQQQGAAAIETLAQSAARDAWQKTYEQGQLDIRRGTFDMERYAAMAGLTGYLPDTGASKRLVDAYNQGARGPESWASTLGVGLPEAQRLYAAAQRWQQQPGNEGKQATDAVLGQIAMQEGINLPNVQGQNTFDRDKYQTDTMLKYIPMMNEMKKRNPFEYLAGLQNTPNSIRGIVNTALQGMGLGGGLQQAGAANTLQGIPQMQQQAPMQPTPPPGYPTPQGPYPGAAPTTPMRSAQPWEVGPQTPVDPRSGMIPPSTPGNTSTDYLSTPGAAGAYGPRPAQPLTGVVGSGAYQAAQQPVPFRVPGQPLPGYQAPPQPGLTPGNQINARDWLNTAPWLKQLTLQGYEQNGQDPSQVVHDFQQSLPKAVGPRRGAVRAG